LSRRYKKATSQRKRVTSARTQFSANGVKLFLVHDILMLPHPQKSTPLPEKEVNFVGALFLEKHKATVRGGRQQEEAMRLLHSVYPFVIRK